MLASGYQMLVVWGPTFLQFYNDAFQPILGAKHPAALGQTSAECWSEIWQDMVSPMFHQVIGSGVTISARDLMFPLDRRGFLEEATVRALGLRRIRQSVSHDDSPTVRGMIAKVYFALSVSREA